MHFFLLNIYGFKPPRQKKNTFYVFVFFCFLYPDYVVPLHAFRYSLRLGMDD